MIIIKYEKCQEQKLNGGNDWNAVCLCLVETDVLVVPTHYQHILQDGAAQAATFFAANYDRPRYYVYLVHDQIYGALNILFLFLLLLGLKVL